MVETRINSLTNRKVKVGKRAYNKLIADGMIDNGTHLILFIRYIKVENHDVEIEFESEAYHKFLNIGYTLDTEKDELKAPKPYIYYQKYPDRSNQSIRRFQSDFNDEELEDLRKLKGIIRINGMSIKTHTNKQIRQHIMRGLYDSTNLIVEIYYQSHILPEFGVLYHGELNCVIRLYENHLKMNEYKKPPAHITKLYKMFKDGFFSQDFDYLARKLGANIYVRSPVSTIKYGEFSNKKNLNLYINNNHCSLDTHDKTHPIIKKTEFVDDVDDYIYSEKLNITRYNKGISLTTDTKIYRNKILKHTNTDDTITEYKTEDYKFNFESQTGLFLNLFIISNPSIISIKKTNKNLEAIRSISQHGLFYARDISKDSKDSKNHESDISRFTYDIKKAYYNYSTWDIYEGIPADLDSAISASAYLANPNILDYAGFGMVEYVDILQPNNIKITRWVSNPFIKMLIRQDRLFNYKYGLISRNKVNLNLDIFNSNVNLDILNPNVNSEPPKLQLLDPPKKNNVWYKVIGKMNQRTTKQMITSTDPLLAFTGLDVSNDTITSKEHSVNLYFGTIKKNEPCKQYYPHIAAYIQFYTEILINELATTAQQQGADILSIWVDEITFNKKIELTTKQAEYFHTDKISKVLNFECALNYRHPQPPVKYSKHFNPIIQNKGNKIILQGGAGTGKSYICKQLHEQMENLQIITPTHQSGSIYKSNEPQENPRDSSNQSNQSNQSDISRTYTTVASKLKHITPEKGAKDAQNIICDEFSMINNTEQHKLESLTPENNLIMFIGDPKQLLPVEGEPIQTSEYNIIELFKNYRQAIDPEFSRKLDILRMDNKADLKFGNPIVISNNTECEILDIVKKGGIIACLTNERVRYFNSLINNGTEYKINSKVRFIKNVLNKMIYNGLNGYITTFNFTELEASRDILNNNKTTILYDGYLIERIEGLDHIKIATLTHTNKKKTINQEITTNELFIKCHINNKIVYYPLEKYKLNLELSYASTVHKLQAQTLKCQLIFDNITHYENLFENLRYTAYSRLTKEADLFILTDYKFTYDN